MTVSDKSKYDCTTCPYPRYKDGLVIFCDVCIRKILDEQKEKGLTIVSVYSCHKKDAVFQDDWKMDQEDVQTFTLATCTGYSRTPYRLVVNCKVTKEKLIL